MDVKSLIEGIEKLLSYMFGGNVPSWVLPTIAWSIAVGLIISGLGFVLRQIKQFLKEFIQPIFYDPEQKRQRLRRQRFADYIESEIRRLNTQEAWSDHRFTELEAEIETQTNVRWFGVFALPELFSRSVIRREKSLSVAIEKNPDRLILIEGDPGSGKSVALRHVAQMMAAKANRSRNLKKVIPFYINLKGLKRVDNQIVDRNLIEQYVLKTINRANDRDVDEYLDEEFKKGIQDGTWFFLFDSFDEIPEILSSTESDEIIKAYADAISDFLHGLNHCKGVLASREYKGPRYLNWSKFKILQLSSERRRALVSRTGLPINTQDAINRGLSLASPDFRLIASNPMFLNILCEYMHAKESDEFPEHTHQVFEKYIWHRLTRDIERIRQRFNLTPEEIKEAAEKIAFCMTADYGLGLTPTKVQLKQSIDKFKFAIGDRFDVFTAALEYLKLARSEEASTDLSSATFTFAHRRFQEYFATSVVIREPQRVSPLELLTNSRWRETAVVILQTKQPSEHQFLIDKAIEIIKSTYATGKEITTVTTSVEQDTNISEIKWTPSLLHLFEILQSGLSGKTEKLPDEIQKIIDNILSQAMRHGLSLDRKWALSVSGIASDEIQQELITSGLNTRSEWLQDVAYEQIARMSKLTEKMKFQLRCILVSMSAKRELFNKRHDVYVQLTRSEETRNLTSVARVLAWAPYLDFAFTLFSIILLRNVFFDSTIEIIVAGISLLFLFLRWHPEFPSLGDFSSFRQSPFWKLVSIGAALYVGIAILMVIVDPSHIISASVYMIKNLPVSLIFLILFVSLNSWTTVLIWEIYNGKRTAFYWWLLFPLYPIVFSGTIWLVVKMFRLLLSMTTSIFPGDLIKRWGIWIIFGVFSLISVAFSTFMEYRLKRIRRTKFGLRDAFKLLYYPLFMLICNGIILILTPIVEPVTKTYSDIVTKIITIVVAAILGIISLVIVFLIFNWFVVFLIEYYKYYSWRKDDSDLEMSNLIKLISNFRSDFIRIQIIRDIRKKKLRNLYHFNIQDLKQILIFVEFCILGKTPPMEIDYEKYGLVSSSEQEDKKTKVDELFQTGWSTKQLDELCRLYEQISSGS